MRDDETLRMAFIAGSLGQGGTEKQLLYLARELRRASVDARVLTLTRGEFYEAAFADAGVPVEWVGHHRLPLRLADLAGAVHRFHPHIVQAVHFFTNLYAVWCARLLGGVGVGAIRGDGWFDMGECGMWGRPLLHAPRSLVANSRAAVRHAEAAGIEPSRLHLLANVIELQPFDGRNEPRRAADADASDVVAVAVGRLAPIKCFHHFLGALARARRGGGRLRGLIVGDGPERGSLETLAGTLGLLPDGVRFLGPCSNVPRVLASADMIVLTSRQEGFPNVLLEAMAARLPAITTPVGDAAMLVDDGRTGFVVPFGDEALLAVRMMALAQSPAMRRIYGDAGRARVEAHYRVDGLAGRALRIYRGIAAQQQCGRTLRAVEAADAAYAAAAGSVLAH
jgi:glycosyltransferase involved in cell wall biosynthesis